MRTTYRVPAKVGMRVDTCSGAGRITSFVDQYVRVLLDDTGYARKVLTDADLTAFAPQEHQQRAIQAEDGARCACGHSLSVEHADDGCMHGCDVDACNKTEVASG